MASRIPPELARKIRQRKARVGVIGLGYVGLPLAVEFARKGYRAVGIDVDAQRTRALNAGRSYIPDIPSRQLGPLVREGKLRGTTDYRVLRRLDAVIICVPTPLRKTREPDLSYIVAAAEALAKHLHRHQIIILESTTYPGTTQELILPILQKSGLKVGRDFFLGFSPERIDPGNKQYTTTSIPKVISGVTPACRRLIQLLYGQVIRSVVPVSSTAVAEMVKLLENTFRSVNIGLVNELALMCHRLGVDVWEVIEAAKTKPFGFMPFYPGPGLGGHCLDGTERVLVKRGHSVRFSTLEELVSQIRSEGNARVLRIRGATFLRPDRLEMLSFDQESGCSRFQPIRWISKRSYRGKMVRVWTADGRHLTVTDRHPMLVESGRLELRLAGRLRKGDEIPILQKMPEPDRSDPSVDLIEHFRTNDSKFLDRMRVTPVGSSWGPYRSWLRPILRRYRKDPWEYYRINQIPLRAYLEAEALPGFPRIEHAQLLLCSGKGPSRSDFRATLKIDERFCRLLGYYLSEGCVTEDESLRVRFSFHSKERELIEDVRDLLSSLGVRHSEHKLKRWNTVQLKVSSVPFGLLFRDLLKCGKDSYTMQIPESVFGLSRGHREALLSGLLRGDGGVDVVSGRHRYRKRGRPYVHRINTASVNYYSVSTQLFQQVVLLLQGMGIAPTFKRSRPNLLTIFGEPQLRRCAQWLIGEKLEKLSAYFKAKLKRMPTKSFRPHGGYATVPVRDLVPLNGTRQVYSVELDQPHTFVTSFGIVVHNCIPIDPLYLSWKARVHGFEPRFIELSSQVNAAMPEHVVERTAHLLNARGRALKGARILILGVAYKPGVGDIRESPALEILQHLRSRGARVRYHDPFVPGITLGGVRLRSASLSRAAVAGSDCVLIVTDHPSVDYPKLVRDARLILDTRNALRGLRPRPKKVVTL